jgi:hypothetical protein
MAPRTRRAQKVNSVLNSVDVIGQDGINVVNPQANLTGGFKIITSGITNIIKSQSETHLFLPSS